MAKYAHAERVPEARKAMKKIRNHQFSMVDTIVRLLTSSLINVMPTRLIMVRATLGIDSRFAMATEKPNLRIEIWK